MKKFKSMFMCLFSMLLLFGKVYSDHSDPAKDTLEGASSAVFMSSDIVFELHGKFKTKEVCIGSDQQTKRSVFFDHNSDKRLFVALGDDEGHDPINFSSHKEDHLNHIALEIFEDPSESKELIAERDLLTPSPVRPSQNRVK